MFAMIFITFTIMAFFVIVAVLARLQMSNINCPTGCPVEA